MNMVASLRVCTLLACVLAAMPFAGCRKKAPETPPVATPSLSLSRSRVPLGSPVDITYRFAVASDAKFAQDYRVMLHVMDADEELMWTDDHNPPVPTSAWKPGQNVEYTRTVFVPVCPYVGEAVLQVGLYSTRDQSRLTMSGTDNGQQAYTVGKLELLPQTENVFVVFKDGWHPAEVAEHSSRLECSMVEWQWTKKSATIAFKNPKKNSLVYLDVDNPGGVFTETQTVQISAGSQPIDSFTLTPGTQLLRKIPITVEQLGSSDMVVLTIDVDKSFVPALLNPATSKDPRELGVRVFHAFVEEKSQ
jgi:hypothetical protein